MKKKISLFLLAALVLPMLLLTGCKGKPLPDGMDETELLDAGREIVTLLNAPDYESVVSRFREDVRQASGITANAVQELMDSVSPVGAYVRETDTLATGQTDEESGEFYGVAVIYCKHEKKTVRYRIAFDTDMTMIGLAIEKL